MKTTLICTNNTPFFLSVLSYSFLAFAQFLVFFLGIIGFDENHLRGGGNAGGKKTKQRYPGNYESPRDDIQSVMGESVLRLLRA